jgi:hypothetical protein
LQAAIRALWGDLLGSLRDLAPIVLVIGGFELLVLDQPLTSLAPLAGGTVLVVAGLTFFIYGLRLALFPVGESLAFSLARKGSVAWLMVFAFVLGFGTTIAEPALIAVTEEASEIAARGGVIEATDEARDWYALGLRLTVAVSVGLAIVIGVLRILTGWSLPVIIIGGYVLVMAMTGLAPAEIIGIAYDSGGVTTSTVTVPLVAALGVGLASAVAERNPMIDGFGLIALASLTPIIFVLAYGMAVQWVLA